MTITYRAGVHQAVGALTLRTTGQSAQGKGWSSLILVKYN